MNAPVTTLPAIGATRIAPGDHEGLIQHVAIFLADGRILSDETFKLHSFQGQEQISGPFELQLELHANTDAKGNVAFAFEDILTRPVTVGLNLPGAGPNDFARAIKGGSEAHLALWNGIASDFAMGVPGVYHLTVRPALWKLSLTNRYEIHRQRNIRDAIETTLGAHGIVPATANGTRNSVSLSAISGADNPAVTRVQDWLQAGESDLDFIQRLLGKAHIYFYFEHHATHHRVIFANRPAYPPALADGRKLRYAQTGTDTLGLEQDDLVLDYRYAQTMTSTSVTGTLARQHAAWEEDTVAQFDTYRAQSSAQPGDLPFHRFQVYQYGGSDGEVRWDTETCDHTRNTSATSMQGSSTCPLMHPGFTITLDEAGAPAVNPGQIRPTLGDRSFVLNSVKHQADLGGTYRNQFQATESYGQVAAFSVHDTQQGWVLAQVVKHDNGEYPKDWRYYQRSAFDPETDKLRDSTSSPAMLRPKGVYVRFATAGADSAPVWIKLAQHMLTAPELGVTVLVSRANDFSELPEIQSIVQNNGHKTVTPSGWTANTSVGCNYQTSYGDNRSVRFGLNSPGNLPPAKTWVDDKYNQGNSDVAGWFGGVHFRDVSWSKGNSSSYSTAEDGRDDVLSESWSIGSTYSQHHGHESKSISDIDYSWSDSTIGASDSYTHTKGRSYSWSRIGEQESDSTIDGLSKNTSKIGGNSITDHTTVGTSDSTQMQIGTSTQKATFKADNNSTTLIEGKTVSHHTVKGTSDSTMHQHGTSTANQTFYADNNSTTHIKGSTTSHHTVDNNSTSTQTISGTSTNHSKIGISVGTSLTGIQTHSSATGITNSNSATGLANSNSATGASVNLAATGASLNLHATGASIDIGVTGFQSRITGLSSIFDITVIGGGLDVKETVGKIETEASGLSANIVSILKAII
ncbi:MAG: hypothetical protein H6980_05170 [Gammaproteobacteria bacterium]|nr:hypothetical protein [Gammaproteobacteria bacterium]